MKCLARTIFFTLIIFHVSSCDEYLSEPPDNRQEINTLEDISALLVKTYPTASALFIERATDNVTVIASEGVHHPFNAFVYRYQMPIGVVTRLNKINLLWTNFYYAIAQANLALEHIDRVPNNNPALKKVYRGEALLCRAYNHFMLVNVFCRAYSDQTSQNLGIPYLTAIEKELVTFYSRGTLEETYEKIEKDLLEGLSLVKNDTYKGVIAKYHFSERSALAFASRFFLFKGDYEACVKYASQLLGEGTVAPVSTFVRNSNEVFQEGTNAEKARKFQSLSAAYNLLFMQKRDCGICNQNSQSRFEANQDLFNYVFASNIQSTEDYRNVSVGNFMNLQGARYTPKYIDRFNRLPNVYAVFRAEEVIFNRMEAYARLGMLDKALADYHVLAPLRYANGGHLTQEQITAFFRGSPQEAMLKFIFSERRKEFFGEGLRWFDIKRGRLPITHVEESSAYELLADDPKRAFQIPESAIANGIQKNPGWE